MIKRNVLHAKLVSSNKIELFWNVSELPIKVVHFYFNHQFAELAQVMRIYDVSHIIFNGLNAHHLFEISVPYHQGSWSVKGLEQNRSFIVEIGVKFPEGKFFPLLRSNNVYTAVTDNATENKQRPYDFTNQIDQAVPPVWARHVSTYSYYKKDSPIGERNG